MHGVTKARVESLIGKQIYAQHKNGTVVSGKLLKVKGQQLVLEQDKGKKVKTKAIIPLVLFDLLAIGTAPFAYGYGGGFPYGGGYGYNGYGGPGSYGGYYGGNGFYR